VRRAREEFEDIRHSPVLPDESRGIALPQSMAKQ